jgi:hypothetical protein
MRTPSETLNLISLFHIICGLANFAITCLVAMLAFVFSVGTFAADSGSNATGSAIVAFASLLVAGIFLVLALANLVIGWGLYQRRSWARLAAIILALFRLPNFPFGSVIGVLIIWYLLSAQAEFGS